MFKQFILLVILILVPNITKAADLDFKVGVILPLTGPAADYGIAIQNGIKLASRENSGSKINFIYEDGAYEPSTVLAALNKLHQIDKVRLLYVWGVKYCFLVSSYVEKNKLPMVAQCVHGEVAKDKTYIIRFLNHANEYMVVLNNYLDKSNLKDIATVISEDTYCEETFRALKEELSKEIKLTEIASLPPKEMDFRSTIARIKSKKYQAVIAFLAPGQNGQFAKQMKELHLDIPVFGHNTYESLSEIKLSQGAMEGAIFANNRVTEEFKNYYLQQYKNDNQITWAGFSYEFTKMLEFLEPSLTSASSGLEIMDIIARYPAKSNSVAGPLNYYENTKVGRYFGFPIVMKTVKDGKIQVLEPSN
ncbi:MAG: ABC transporter substrate-binding protein [Proteobacteria bacterium]|nr:ABC transporter substrate-binding protein [Pseudomonadota bacterium]